eukprot:6172376-Pleurochrysis_carterae.AAC.1
MKWTVYFARYDSWSLVLLATHACYALVRVFWHPVDKISGRSQSDSLLGFEIFLLAEAVKVNTGLTAHSALGASERLERPVARPAALTFKLGLKMAYSCLLGSMCLSWGGCGMTA